MTRTAIALLQVLGLATPAMANLDKAMEAYNRADFATARKEFRASAKNGEPRAQYSLGLLYIRGQGVKPDLKEVMKWLRKAAGQGDGEARMMLGDLYRKDIPMLRNLVKSYMWLTLAAHKVRGKKRDTTFRMRKQVGARMSQAQIDKANQMARDWRALAKQRRK